MDEEKLDVPDGLAASQVSMGASDRRFKAMPMTVVERGWHPGEDWIVSA